MEDKEREQLSPSDRLHRTLLIIGIVIVVLSILAIVIQLPIYMENRDAMDRHFYATPGTSANGANGSFMQSLVAWNKSGAAAGQAALYTMITMAIVGAGGLLLILVSIRHLNAPPPAPPMPEPKEEEEEVPPWWRE